MSALGHRLRLNRIMDPATATAIVLPMDHAIEEAGFGELERPAALVAELADAGVDCFLMRRGLARFAADAIGGKAGWIERLTGRTGLAPDHAGQLVLASVEQALRNGADAVVPTFFLGPDTEPHQLPELGRIADECARLGMPLLAEIFPAGSPGAVPYDGPYSVEELRIAVRVASEEGADLIKTYYTGDPASFAAVVDYSLVPVIVAGGPRAESERDVLEFAHGAMQAGARGIAMGRKVWQSRDPAALVRALARIVREGASVDDALGELQAVGAV
jgi:fructose-bisphosphate aldolase / 2-amino-3,7-dideoxy-D-threo-hept-6-ulosonate synthase